MERAETCVDVAEIINCIAAVNHVTFIRSGAPSREPEAHWWQASRNADTPDVAFAVT